MHFWLACTWCSVFVQRWRGVRATALVSLSSMLPVRTAALGPEGPTQCLCPAPDTAPSTTSTWRTASCPKHPKPVPLQERVPELFMTHFPSRYENSYTFNRLLTFFYIVTAVTVCIKWWKPAKNHKTRSQIKYNAHKGRSNSCCFPTKMMSLPGGWCHKGTSFC